MGGGVLSGPALPCPALPCPGALPECGLLGVAGVPGAGADVPLARQLALALGLARLELLPRVGRRRVRGAAALLACAGGGPASTVTPCEFTT